MDKEITKREYYVFKLKQQMKHLCYIINARHGETDYEIEKSSHEYKVK